MNRGIETIVGLFVLVGLGAVLYLAIKVGGVGMFGESTYELTAQFSRASGVSKGSRVEIAGVRVGTVTKIELDDVFYAVVTIELPERIKIEDDTIAAIKTSGLIGDRYIELLPGGSGIFLGPGEMILDTESPVDVEDLIKRFAVGGIDKEE